MLNTRPMASLTSGLLARKGQARPAMRRQAPASLAALPGNVEEDLGWNDMGSPEPVAPTHAPTHAHAPAPEPLPLVLEERAQLAAALAPPPPPVAAPVARVAGGRKAAFTLRLDAERHLRLRLASAVRGMSAQQIVTEALDALIGTMPQVDALQAQLAAGDTKIVRGD
ncbi:MAG: hypothetical protein PGN23_10600 [Sphingomonas adhaesiva]|uniref:hypothetical protein n=1 Tax=Sphingomonas adhaesiva TaxID=28212 RepID=UPI002FF72F77